MNKILKFIGQGFGSGLCPFMPGTCGSIVGLIIFILCNTYFSLLVLTIIAIFMTTSGIIICDISEKILQKYDDKSIVWDEICGYFIAALICQIILSHKLSLLALSQIFIIFRLFDISKIFPLNIIDKRFQGGLSIMLDDILAAIYTAITFYLLSNLI